jgi:hypothetical protein
MTNKAAQNTALASSGVPFNLSPRCGFSIQLFMRLPTYNTASSKLPGFITCATTGL